MKHLTPTYLVALVLCFALFGCGSSSSNSTSAVSPSQAKTGTVPVDIQLLPQANAKTASKASFKTDALASSLDLSLRSKIDHINFFTIDSYGACKQVASLSANAGRVTGVITIDEGSYNLQAFCITKGGVQLYAAFQDVVIESGKVTNVMLVFERSVIAWMAAKIKNFPGLSRDNHYFVGVEGLTGPGYGTSDGDATIDLNGELSFTNSYLTTIAISKVRVTVVDQYGNRSSAIFTYDLLADIEESDQRGYAEKTWPAPGTINIDGTFKEDGNYVGATFDTNTPPPLKFVGTSILSAAKIFNGTNAEALIESMKVTIWDANFVSNVKLVNPASGVIYNCAETSKNEWGMSKYTCPTNLTLSQGLTITLRLVADVENYPADQCITTEFSGAQIIDSNNQPVAYSGTGSISYANNVGISTGGGGGGSI